MMSTNEERHTIAEEMRQRMREGYSFSRFNIAEEIGKYEGDYDDPYKFDEDCWSRLADLIDPEPTVDRDALLALARDLEVSIMDSGACGDVAGLVLNIVKQIREACGEVK